LRCLKIKRRYISDTDSIQIADYYTKIASLYSDLGDSQKAIDYLRQADAIVPISKEKKGQIYVSYGYYFAELGIPDSALYYYEKAMILYDGWNNKINLQAVLNYYSNKQKYYKNVKIKTIDSLEAIIKEHDLKGDLPQLLALKSHVLKDTIYIHRAIELSQKYRPVFYIEIIKELSDLQFELKNFEESRANLELYHKLKDSVEQYKSGAILDDLSEIGSSVAENDENNTEKFKIYLPLALVIIVSLLAFIIFTKFSTYRRKK
jgi:tetratricopeptide (TPR) repeat protein